MHWYAMSKPSGWDGGRLPGSRMPAASALSLTMSDLSTFSRPVSRKLPVPALPLQPGPADIICCTFTYVYAYTARSHTLIGHRVIIYGISAHIVSVHVLTLYHQSVPPGKSPPPLLRRPGIVEADNKRVPVSLSLPAELKKGTMVALMAGYAFYPALEKAFKGR